MRIAQGYTTNNIYKKNSCPYMRTFSAQEDKKVETYLPLAYLSKCLGLQADSFKKKLDK